MPAKISCPKVLQLVCGIIPYYLPVELMECGLVFVAVSTLFEAFATLTASVGTLICMRRSVTLCKDVGEDSGLSF